MSSPVRDAPPPVLSQGHDKPGAVSLHIVAIPDPDRAAEWTRLIAKPFENPDKTIRVARVQADAGFVEHFNCVLQFVADRHHRFAVRFPWVD